MYIYLCTYAHSILVHTGTYLYYAHAYKEITNKIIHVFEYDVTNIL